MYISILMPKLTCRACRHELESEFFSISRAIYRFYYHNYCSGYASCATITSWPLKHLLTNHLTNSSYITPVSFSIKVVVTPLTIIPSLTAVKLLSPSAGSIAFIVTPLPSSVTPLAIVVSLVTVTLPATYYIIIAQVLMCVVTDIHEMQYEIPLPSSKV